MSEAARMQSDDDDWWNVRPVMGSWESSRSRLGDVSCCQGKRRGRDGGGWRWVVYDTYVSHCRAEDAALSEP